MEAGNRTKAVPDFPGSSREMANALKATNYWDNKQSASSPCERCPSRDDCPYPSETLCSNFMSWNRQFQT